MELNEVVSALKARLATMPIITANVGEQRLSICIGHTADENEVKNLVAWLSSVDFFNAVEVRGVGEGYCVTVLLSEIQMDALERLVISICGIVIPKILLQENAHI